MTKAEWDSAAVADLVLYTLDIHRARHGAEPAGTVFLAPPRAAMRVDLGRKHMLLAHGVLRRYWGGLDPELRQAVAVLEEFESAPDHPPDPPLDDFAYVSNLFIDHVNRGTIDSETVAALYLVFHWWPAVKQEWPELPESWRPLFDDVFGDFFRPAIFDPQWRTADALGLAREIYEDRAFHLLPILADALMDAGCDSQEILGHCRSDGPHIRGCWVVDLVLGKE